jgi:hypothetical protein
MTGKDRQNIVRHHEHREKARLKELKDVSSKFYQSYPSQCATYNNNTRRGYVDQLNLYYGLAFDRNGKVDDLLTTTSESSYSLLHWPTDCLKKLKNSNVMGVEKEYVKKRQLHMASYLFEFGYDLCLSPCDNVLMAPGFESIICCHDNQH